ncbi:MAG TPA: LuxR C-terminal-related transcriptional regulator [Spirochaetia bacterium]|nr:LuxR C-terminal-related transcriptional regulator [Spirochaetia bacterium]
MSDLSFLKRWIHTRAPAAADGRQEMVREFEQFFTYIFNTSPDGITILDLDFTILGVNTTMERWYPSAPLTGRKCFEMFHGRGVPCENCPTIACRATGRPQTGLVPYEAGSQVRGTQELSVFPLYDDNGKLFCLIEYVREITALSEEERTIETLKKRIQIQDTALHEQEIALEVLLRRSDRAERRVVADVLANITASVSPVISRLKERLAGTEHFSDVELLESRVNRITSPLINRLTSQNRQFTPREREIASLVAEGRTSKEIADRLYLTIKAVDFHRMNLRRKLRIEGSAKSLQARLLELEQTQP